MKKFAGILTVGLLSTTLLGNSSLVHAAQKNNTSSQSVMPEMKAQTNLKNFNIISSNQTQTDLLYVYPVNSRTQVAMGVGYLGSQVYLNIGGDQYTGTVSPKGFFNITLQKEYPEGTPIEAYLITPTGEKSELHKSSVVAYDPTLYTISNYKDALGHIEKFKISNISADNVIANEYTINSRNFSFRVDPEILKEYDIDSAMVLPNGGKSIHVNFSSDGQVVFKDLPVGFLNNATIHVIKADKSITWPVFVMNTLQ
ncbi:hypothetical protein GKC32_06975 [Lactobacillus curvatus]|nr:hypothetical protein [Latilactobacillus curvatus]MSE24212.1 hypothetical protein [Latilactobacillus curvatus]